MFYSTGKLIYDPHARIRSEPWWCILKTDEGIIDYYKYWIMRHYDVKFEKTVWGSHISVNRGVKPPNLKKWSKHQGEIIPFTYTNRVYRINNWFYCVDAYSKRLEDIRVELGMAKTPPYGFHITIGRIDKQYILEQPQNKCFISSHLSGNTSGPMAGSASSALQPGH